jgi:hypothetical protein
VQDEAGQAAHPGPRTLERQHDLPLELLLSVGQLGGRQTFPREPRVLAPDRLDGRVRCAGLGADVDAELSG